VVKIEIEKIDEKGLFVLEIVLLRF